MRGLIGLALYLVNLFEFLLRKFGKVIVFLFQAWAVIWLISIIRFIFVENQNAELLELIQVSIMIPSYFFIPYFIRKYGLKGLEYLQRVISDKYENCINYKSESYSYSQPENEEYYKDRESETNNYDEAESEYYREEDTQYEESTTYAQDEIMDLFKGCTTDDEIKKRYKDLLKIYHPDNQNGDTEMSQKIQNAYDKILIEG